MFFSGKTIHIKIKQFLKRSLALTEQELLPESEPEYIQELGRSPRKKLPFLFAITGTLFLLGLLFFFLFFSSDKKIETSMQAKTATDSAQSPPDKQLREEQDFAEGEQTAAPSGQPSPKEESALDESFLSKATNAIVTLPPEIDITDLDNIDLPQHPYSIYINAFKGIQDAKVALRELASKNLSAYIIPVDIHGNVSQSLYGVTQNGRWYRVFVGSYPDKEEARKILAQVTEKAPTFQPEILPFSFALECGLFTSQQEAQKLLKQLSENEFWPYLQIFETQDGNNLWRILVGCFFSIRGAQTQRNQLETEDYSCRVVMR